jgi:hypothetical protein
VGQTFTIGTDNETGGIDFGDALTAAKDFQYIISTKDYDALMCKKTDVFAVVDVVCTIGIFCMNKSTKKCCFSLKKYHVFFLIFFEKLI